MKLAVWHAKPSDGRVAWVCLECAASGQTSKLGNQPGTLTSTPAVYAIEYDGVSGGPSSTPLASCRRCCRC
jgi:hypothetical protein